MARVVRYGAADFTSVLMDRRHRFVSEYSKTYFWKPACSMWVNCLSHAPANERYTPVQPFDGHTADRSGKVVLSLPALRVSL